VFGCGDEECLEPESNARRSERSTPLRAEVGNIRKVKDYSINYKLDPTPGGIRSAGAVPADRGRVGQRPECSGVAGERAALLHGAAALCSRRALYYLYATASPTPHVAGGSPVSVFEPTEHISNLASLVRAKALKNGAKPAIRFEERVVSYLELDDRSSRLAGALHELGVGRGDRVASMMYNSPDVLFLWFGCAKLGAVYVPLNPALKGELLRFELRDCDPSMLVYDERVNDAVASVAKDCPGIRTIPYSREGQYSDRAAHTFHRMLAGSGRVDLANLSPADAATIMYTSGTTGMPKGAVLSHAAYLQIGHEISRVAGCRPGDVFFATLPLFHTSGQVMSTMPALLNDLVVAHAEWFHASKFWEQASEHGATITFLLSSMTNILFKTPPGEFDRKHRIRVAMTGGMPKPIWKAFEERFAVQVVEGFGMTETCGVAILNRHDDMRFGSIGKPLGHVEARIAGEGGRELLAGSAGELWLRERIPNATFTEYFRRSVETQQFRVGGWMRTGDLMQRDEDGYYYYVDRKKDVIRVRGENASPTLIENALLDHPAVLEVVAVSVPSEIGDDEIKVAVKPKEGKRLDPLELAKWAESRLPYYLVPRFIEVVDEIPKTPSLKPQRYLIQSSGTDRAVDLRGLGYKPTRPN
jgi:crotonobetaine/carnitine-CoA ligase